MVNAQEWLNSKFPTLESKKKVKQLRIYYLSGNDEEKSSGEWYFFNVRLEGELDLSEFINLEVFLTNLNSITPRQAEINISKIKLGGCAKLNTLKITNYPRLHTIEGLEKCSRLVDLRTELCPTLNLTIFLEFWKKEVGELKRQIGELERGSLTSMPGSWETESDSSESLNTKIQRKKQELQEAITGGRQSTAPLRKQIELLERIQKLEEKIRELTTKEAEYQRQIREKDEAIAEKEKQIQTLSESEKVDKQKIGRLEKQIEDLEKEKNALQEKMLGERQEALKEWEKEKSKLEEEQNALIQSKDTFQKSADYLRERLWRVLKRVWRRLRQS